MTIELPVERPELMLADPQPRPVLRSFHRRKMPIWEGNVLVASIRGWDENKRTELHVQQWEEEKGRKPTDDELYHLVVEDDLQKIKPLSANIRENGVRTPVILAKDGRLLDGNRRYFAVRMLLEELSAAERAEFEKIPAWVLATDRPDDEINVITERNMVKDFKLEWPYSVQARQVYEDRYERGMSIKEIAKKYDATTSRVSQMIQAVELADDFVSYHGDLDRDRNRANRIVYEHLIWFDQVRRSHAKLVNEDYDFRKALFEMLYEVEPGDRNAGTAKFEEAKDFVKLGAIRRNPEAWERLTSGKGRVAFLDAERIVDAEKAYEARDVVGKLERVTKLLESIAGDADLGKAGADLLARFHHAAAQVPDGPADVKWQFGRMRKFLDGMTVEQVGDLGKKELDLLLQSQERVVAMRKGWQRKRA